MVASRNWTLADVDAAEGVAPFLGFGADVVADEGAHVVAILEHVGELEVAEIADGGVADIGAERAARIGILEEIGDGIADPHFVPDADAPWARLPRN